MGAPIPLRGRWAVSSLVFPQQFRASWRFQASLKLLQHDLTNPAPTAAHAWADAGAGASGAAAEAAGSPVHAAASAREPDTCHQRQRPHQPAPRHPGAHGGPQGTQFPLRSASKPALFNTDLVLGVFGNQVLQISCALAWFAACFVGLVAKNGKSFLKKKFV